ncbi:stage II sporulation protein D [Bacillus sp. FJAT-45350]|uniref:stage II sporulation protein D n=1 Tax=Bacillus sp. FJAT-45350 TaxID=2011014 RepID=UPI000BB6A713|nr:stage II sporulation protein D [Bacillus sp. FJAT-45350]
MKPFIVIGIILCSIILILPTIMVVSFSEGRQTTATTNEAEVADVTTINESVPTNEIDVLVYRSQKEEIERVPLEEYVVGVVASEMPANFEMEALKAQSLTARTYVIKQMLQPGEINLPDGAIVTDTVMHQVYHNNNELKERWNTDYDWKMTRIKDAVYSTAGKVLTFEGQPIDAAFFSTSNGYTENSEDYWQNPIPYLRSVESPWDQESPRYQGEMIIPIREFEQKLSVQVPSDGTVGEIVERTDGGRVAEVKVNGTVLKGREVREKLDLDSSDFRWKRQGNNIVIETKGWGHGVGMSQYGADGMAKEGKTYADIVSHYYQGVAITELEPYVASLTANNTQ